MDSKINRISVHTLEIEKTGLVTKRSSTENSSTILDIDSLILYVENDAKHFCIFAILLFDRVKITISDNNDSENVIFNSTFMIKLHSRTNISDNCVYGGICIVNNCKWDNIQIAVWQIDPPYSYLIFDFSSLFSKILASLNKVIVDSLPPPTLIKKKKISLYDLSNEDNRKNIIDDTVVSLPNSDSSDFRNFTKKDVSNMTHSFEETLSYLCLSIDLLPLISNNTKTMIFGDCQTDYHIFIKAYNREREFILSDKCSNPTELSHSIILTLTSNNKNSKNHKTYVEYIDILPHHSQFDSDISDHSNSEILNIIERNDNTFNALVTNIKHIRASGADENNDLILIERNDQRLFLADINHNDTSNIEPSAEITTNPNQRCCKNTKTKKNFLDLDSISVKLLLNHFVNHYSAYYHNVINIFNPIKQIQEFIERKGIIYLCVLESTEFKYNESWINDNFLYFYYIEKGDIRLINNNNNKLRPVLSVNINLILNIEDIILAISTLETNLIIISQNQLSRLVAINICSKETLAIMKRICVPEYKDFNRLQYCRLNSYFLNENKDINKTHLFNNIDSNMLLLIFSKHVYLIREDVNKNYLFPQICQEPVKDSKRLYDFDLLNSVCSKAIKICDLLVTQYSDNKATSLISVLSRLTDIIRERTNNLVVVSKNGWKVVKTFQVLWKLIKTKICDKLRLYDKRISDDVLRLLNSEEESLDHNRIDVLMLLYNIINCDIISILPSLIKYGIEMMNLKELFYSLLLTVPSITSINNTQYSKLFDQVVIASEMQLCKSYLICDNKLKRVVELYDLFHNRNPHSSINNNYHNNNNYNCMDKFAKYLKQYELGIKHKSRNVHLFAIDLSLVLSNNPNLEKSLTIILLLESLICMDNSKFNFDDTSKITMFYLFSFSGIIIFELLVNFINNNNNNNKIKNLDVLLLAMKPFVFNILRSANQPLDILRVISNRFINMKVLNIVKDNNNDMLEIISTIRSILSISLNHLITTSLEGTKEVKEMINHQLQILIIYTNSKICLKPVLCLLLESSSLICNNANNHLQNQSLIWSYHVVLQLIIDQYNLKFSFFNNSKYIDDIQKVMSKQLFQFLVYAFNHKMICYEQKTIIITYCMTIISKILIIFYEVKIDVSSFEDQFNVWLKEIEYEDNNGYNRSFRERKLFVQSLCYLLYSQEMNRCYIDKDTLKSINFSGRFLFQMFRYFTNNLK